jgi:hypothetical protein
MTEQPLSDERVRDLFAWAYAWRSADGDGETDLSGVRARNRAEFDRWFAPYREQAERIDKVLALLDGAILQDGQDGTPEDDVLVRAVDVLAALTDQATPSRTDADS